MNVITILCIFLASSIALADSPVGTFMVVKGQVTVQHADGKTEKARIGLKVFPKDIIQTMKDARGKIVMMDKNVINISPDSKMEIQDYTFKPDEDKKSVLLNLMYGKVRPQVNQKYDEKKNTFRVKTSAAVAGVRGTDFIVSFQNNRSQITTFHGLVSVGSAIGLGGQIANPVGVSAGQATTVNMNAAPQAPVLVPPADLVSMDKDSSGDGKTIESRQPASEPAPKENKKEDPKDAKDAKAGVKEPKAETKDPKAKGPATSGTASRSPQSASPGLLPPPPPPPSGEVTVLPGPTAGLPPVPNLPQQPIAPPVNPIVGDIIQQTNTSVNLIIVGP